jgi:hypothetical protein
MEDAAQNVKFAKSCALSSDGFTIGEIDASCLLAVFEADPVELVLSEPRPLWRNVVYRASNPGSSI